VSRPTITAIVTDRWDSASEDGWYLRQVAGALACEGEVHVLCPSVPAGTTATDGVFSLRGLGAGSGGPETERSVEATSARALGLLESIGPHLLVVGGDSIWSTAVASALQGAGPRVILLPLAQEGDVLGSGARDALEHSDVVVVATRTEQDAVFLACSRHDAIRHIGPTVTPDPSVLAEPNPWVGDTGSIIVITGDPVAGTGVSAQLAQLIRLRFPRTPVGIVASDTFSVWHQGRVSEGWAVSKRSDLLRLVAWAGVVVDLRPGRYLARRTIDAITYGTPVVVPDHGPAREYAADGCGMWFGDPAELLWAIEAIEDPDVGASFRRRSLEVAHERFLSTRDFIGAVHAAIGMEVAPATGPPEE